MSNSIQKSSIFNSAEGKISSKIAEVFKVFQNIFAQYKPSEVFLSFNGGKDCTVLLDLLQSFFRISDQYKNCTIRYIYIQPENPFVEMEDFIELCAKTYDIKIEKIRGDLRTVLENLCKNHPELKAVIMGSRRSDPYCDHLKILQHTDPTWPPLLRVSPLLDWSCKDIWEYILYNEIPYCSLYNEGYTSIGDRMNTKRNPHLKVINSSDTVSYRPAYELLDDKLEREGRL